jgi:HD-like signal output (HDOD) protein
MEELRTTPADAGLLSQFIPFGQCSQDELIVLADHAGIAEVKKGHVLAEAGSTDPWDIYLVEGSLKLVAADGKVSYIVGGSRTARAPIAHLQPRKYTIQAVTPVKYLRVENALLRNLSYGPKALAVSLDDADEHEDLSENPLYVEIVDELVNDRLVVPSMPEVAVKIRRLVDEDSTASMAKIAAFIQSDVAVSAKLIKAANGALYHGLAPVDTCKQAIQRLGLKTTKHLVMSFVVANLFRERIHTPLVTAHARRLWEHSVEVGAICQALARVTPGLDAEEALLVGLLHDIGELIILSYAEKYPGVTAEETTLQRVIADLRAEIGATTLLEWRFAAPFVTAAREAENWRRDSGPQADYCDVVLVAQLHAFFGTPRMEGLPAFGEIPAFHKLADGELTPQLSMMILDEAKEQIRETKRLLLT